VYTIFNERNRFKEKYRDFMGEHPLEEQKRKRKELEVVEEEARVLKEREDKEYLLEEVLQKGIK